MRNIFIVFLLFTFSFHSTNAQITPTAPITAGISILGAYVVGADLFNQIDQTIKKAMGNAELMADGMFSKLNNQLYVASQNMKILLGTEIDNKINKLDTKVKAALVELEKLRLSIEGFKKTAFDLKDAMVLNIQSIIGNIFPWAKVDFLVQQIDGVLQLKSDNEYRIKFTGIGFGANSDKFLSSIVKVSINGKEYKSYSENKLGNYTSYLILNSDVINNELVAPDKIGKVKISIQVETQRKKLFGWLAKANDLEFTLDVYPNYAGKYKIKYFTTKKTWVDEIIDYKTSYTTPDHDQHRERPGNIQKFLWTTQYSLPDNKRFVKEQAYSSEYSGEGCPFIETIGIRTENDGKTVRIWGNTWGPPCLIFYGGTIQKLVSVSDSTVLITEKEFRYGEYINFEIPADVNYWIVEGITINNKKFEITNKDSYLPLIQFSDIIEMGDEKKRVLYKVNILDASMY